METSYLKLLSWTRSHCPCSRWLVCKEARQKMLEIQPQCDPDEVRYALEQTDAINSLLRSKWLPAIWRGRGCASWLPAPSRGVLSMGELLMVAGAFAQLSKSGAVIWFQRSRSLPTDDLFYALSRSQVWSSRSPVRSWHRMPWQIQRLVRSMICAKDPRHRNRSGTVWRAWCGIMDTSKYLQERCLHPQRTLRRACKSESIAAMSASLHDVLYGCYSLLWSLRR